ncbi:MAG: BlaI/MecI/CopY family transcriptional regulator [Candidatus Kerfeldbacteria bacterium]|nr:BlaI/MecI/CopY family transcriptional regulator [Candidatus Kerfeldbacteria bacterium]
MPKYAFGELEAAIMEIVWHRGWLTVREVVEILRPQRRAAYTTVMTVMNRLAEHAVLERQPTSSGAYRYNARYTREEYSTRASKHSIEELVRRYGDVALVQFLDKLDRVPGDKMNRLRKQLRHDRS